MIRIRYKESDDGILSSRLETTTHGVILIRINLVKFTYEIMTEVGNRLVYNTNPRSKSRQHLLKDVKEQLKTLGIQFYDEIRKKTKRK